MIIRRQFAGFYRLELKKLKKTKNGAFMFLPNGKYRNIISTV